LGVAVGTPPLHVVIEPTRGPLEPVMRLAMKALRPPGG
jgi:hypothetical protein